MSKFGGTKGVECGMVGFGILYVHIVWDDSRSNRSLQSTVVGIMVGQQYCLPKHVDFPHSSKLLGKDLSKITLLLWHSAFSKCTIVGNRLVQQ